MSGMQPPADREASRPAVSPQADKRRGPRSLTRVAARCAAMMLLLGAGFAVGWLTHGSRGPALTEWTAISAAGTLLLAAATLATLYFTVRLARAGIDHDDKTRREERQYDAQQRKEDRDRDELLRRQDAAEWDRRQEQEAVRRYRETSPVLDGILATLPGGTSVNGLTQELQIRVRSPHRFTHMHVDIPPGCPIRVGNQSVMWDQHIEYPVQGSAIIRAGSPARWPCMIAGTQQRAVLLTASCRDEHHYTFPDVEVTVRLA